MTKIIKMSLVAAVAVAGFTSTASAKSLEDAIKNVDVSGFVRYRYTNGSVQTENNQYRLITKFKSKVNDNVTAVVGTDYQAGTNNESGDADPQLLHFTEANFVINAGGATIIAGKQALATPFADPVDQQGTGIVAVKPLTKTLTLAAGWYTNSDAKAKGGTELSGHNITALALIGSINAVSYSLWGADVSESNGEADNDATNDIANVNEAGASAYSINLAAKVGPVNVELNHAAVDYSGANAVALGTQELTKLIVSGKAGIATITAGYVKAGTDGGDVTLGDEDAKTNFLMEQFDARNLTDTDALYLGVKLSPAANVTLGLDYGATSDTDGSVAGDTELSETRFTAAYMMSKNFKVSGFVSSLDNGTDTEDKTRVELKYTF